MEVKQSGATNPHSLPKMATQPMPEMRSTSLNTHRFSLETFDWLCAGLREALHSRGVTHRQAELTVASWIRPAARRSYYMQIPRASKMAVRHNRYCRASRRDVAPNLPCTQTQQHTRNTGATNQARPTHTKPDRNPGDKRNTTRTSLYKATPQATTRLHHMGDTTGAEPRGKDTGPCGSKPYQDLVCGNEENSSSEQSASAQMETWTQWRGHQQKAGLWSYSGTIV
ncbi:Hypothetical predicted protein, partial [Pelobates cultripes]